MITHSRPGSFGTLTGDPGDNAALAAALALKLDKAGGTMAGALAITAGGLNTSPLAVSQTWNNAGVTCRGLELAVTDTNSAAGSTALRLLGGAAGTTVLFSVDKGGNVQVGGNPIAFTNTGGFSSYGNLIAFFDAAKFTLFGDLALNDAKNFEVGSTTGTKIGTATTQKLGFWNATPVVQQVLATGGGATVDDVITLLQTLGLCRQS
jgi:hypothetical protein